MAMGLPNDQTVLFDVSTAEKVSSTEFPQGTELVFLSDPDVLAVIGDRVVRIWKSQ